MKKILIIGLDPKKNDVKDGFLRRILEIDGKLSKYSKEYYELRVRDVFTNLFKSFKLVRKSDMIYSHTIVNLTKILPVIYFFNKKIILDFHGVLPEEIKYNGQSIQYKIFNFIEKILMNKISKAIFVTESMKNFYLSKYPKNKILKNGLVLPILDTNILENSLEKNCIDNIPKDKVKIIYSGGLSRWQNIDLMLETIKKLENANYFYIFLTAEKLKLKLKLDKSGISEKNYYLETVSPKELWKYYQVSNYGFVLRDDCSVNRVANPTKLSEYLEYGVIPIVKLEEIGDYKELGYEYIKLESLNHDLKNIKSSKNIELIKNYRKKVEKIDFIKFIES